MDSLCLHGQSSLLGSNLLAGSTPALRIPARHVSHARVSGVFLGCYAAGNECGRGYFEMSWPIAWSARPGLVRAGAGRCGARKPLRARASGSCHIRVTERFALAINHPIVVRSCYTKSVSAYRKVERRPGPGAVTSGTFI